MIKCPSPIHQCEGGPCVAGVVPKGGNSAAGAIGQEFKIEKGATASWKTREDGVPIRLAFIAVGKLDVSMMEGNFRSN